MKKSPSIAAKAGLLVLGLLLLPFVIPCSGGGGGGGNLGSLPNGPLVIPQQGDWVDRGTTGIQASGVPNDWDYRIDGAISPIAAIKRGSTYYLYYIGADGNRTSDNGPRHRALGVATSTNGQSFTPSPNNPILENLPNNNEEEGIFSGTVVVDDAGNTILYYGALQANSPTATTVNSDARRLTSTNSIDFGTAAGPIVLSHSNTSVWNYGDEIYPIGLFRNGSAYHLYYTSQGNVVNWGLGLASGSTSNFTSTQPLINPTGNTNNQIIGGGAVVLDTPSSFLLFTLRSFANRVIEVREVPTANPSDIGSPVRSYTGFPGVQHFTVLLDEQAGQWFLYIAQFSFIRVYTAPVTRM